MAILPIITGKAFVKLLEKNGFEVVRISCSHYRLKHSDGRVTTVPVHSNSEISKGLLRKIIREDLRISVEEFISLV